MGKYRGSLILLSMIRALHVLLVLAPRTASVWHRSAGEETNKHHEGFRGKAACLYRQGKPKVKKSLHLFMKLHLASFFQQDVKACKLVAFKKHLTSEIIDFSACL